MKDINVYLRLGSHPLYKELVAVPPRRVNYTLSGMTTANSSGPLRAIKRKVWKGITAIMPPQFNYSGSTNLVHSCYSSLVRTNAPWVVDTEHAASFANYHMSAYNRPTYRRQIEHLLSAASCKRIMTWSNAAHESMVNDFPTEVANKCVTIYPAIRPHPIRREKTNTVRLLAVSRSFDEKGGRRVLHMFNDLRKHFDVSLTMVSNAPTDIIKQYKGVITFVKPNLSQERLLDEFYTNADIFLQPSFSDTFGFTMLEAMSTGLPIVTTDVFAGPELVEDGKNGFLVHSDLSALDEKHRLVYHWDYGNWSEFLARCAAFDPRFNMEFTAKVRELVEDASLRNRMGRRSLEMVKNGRFSITARNAALRKAYTDALGI